MKKQIAEQLIRDGWDKEWVSDILSLFVPKADGKYQMLIFDIEDLSDEPEDGTYLDTACFDNEVDLSIIHHFYEGCAYVMTIKSTGEEIGRGIIDGAPFDEVEEVGKERWSWLGPEELGPEYKEQRDKWMKRFNN